MLTTIEAFDEMFADAARRASANANLVSDSAQLYMHSISAANRKQLDTVDYVHHTILRSIFDFQNASFLLSRSVLDAAAQLNHALFEWAATVIWPWSPLGPLTEPYPVATVSQIPVPEADYDATQVGDCVMSALRFQGPMGIIASGMGEAED